MSKQENNPGGWTVSGQNLPELETGQVLTISHQEKTFVNGILVEEFKAFFSVKKARGKSPKT